MIDRRVINNFDWSILFVLLLLSFIGVMTIYSSTRPVSGMGHQTFYLRQIYWIAISIIAFFVIVSIDYRWMLRLANILYVLGIILLIAVLVAGRKGMGAQRWINLGFVSFQPSEFFKILFVMSLARYISGIGKGEGIGLKELLKMSLFFLVIPVALILKQPDLGTALIMLFIFTAMVVAAGLRKKIILVILIVGLIALPFVGNVLWGGLKGYQKQRIIAFIDPQADPHGIGYHITQSKVSIGSGGLIGKGYLKGTQGPYRFLPENHTDFIFSIFAEEWGFAGSIFLFILYLFVIWKGFDTAINARDREGCLLSLGVTFMFSFYFFINVGMTLGIVPVVGVPLPLMSYGGTALLSNFLAFSMIENVRMRRFALYY